MAAGIELDDYMVSGSGIMPWHGTNVTVVEGQLTAEAALKAAKLDWAVEKRPVIIEKTGGGYQTVPRYFATVRISDGKPLGIVQDRYRVLQNADAFDWANFMVGGDGAHFETAGSLKGGRIVYVTLKTPFKTELPGGDKLETYVLISNRHDGSGSVTAAVITIRVVCANTLSASISGALGRVGIRHTASMESKLGEAQRVLGLAQGAADRAEETAAKLLSQKMSEQKFNAFLDLLLKPEVASNQEPSAREKAAVERRREAITTVYRENPTQETIRGTAWGAYNAVTFYNDHLTPRRESPSGPEESTPADQRMLAILAGNNIGDRALDILMDGIGGGRWLTGRSK